MTFALAGVTSRSAAASRVPNAGARSEVRRRQRWVSISQRKIAGDFECGPVPLAQGEAFFEVAKDPNRPFVVEAGEQRFIAVGTKFSVRRDSGSNRLIVTEGRVRIEAKPTLISRESAQATEVSAGGVARSGGAGILVQEKPVAEAEVMLSWRSGYLVFEQTPLADAVAEFNRYNETKIVIDDAVVAGILIGGNFRSTNVEAFVRLLEDGFPLRIERQGERIVLSRS